MSTDVYQALLDSPSGKNWQRIGLKRRAGVVAPLFSIYSKKSVGIGEIPDLKLLVDWCTRTGLSMIQLLPMNDVGGGFQPYDAASGFALEPMYLSLEQLREVDLNPFKRDINQIKKRFPAGGKRVNYSVKAEKMNLLWNIYQSVKKNKNSASFKQFLLKNQYWLEDYACFKVLSQQHSEKSWEAWPQEFKDRNSQALAQFKNQHLERLHFYTWLQWQLFLQFGGLRSYAKQKNVLLMGDLPFLAARNSADVWAHPNYFKLDMSSGAPPDAYFANGQRWGMPPCHWDSIAAHGYEYVNERLAYAEHFYDLLRIDHVVGLFRLWSIPISEPLENGGLNGFFDPPDEAEWEAHGRKLLSIFLNSKMLACAEDLGTVPECSYRVLAEFGIPGIDVQRWARDLNQPTTFKSEGEYRKNSTAMISTHDMASFNGWWEYEAGTVYGPLFKRQCEKEGINFDGAQVLLFDLDHSKHDRLRWRDDVRESRIVAERLGRPEQEIGDLINDYKLSYRERQKFWKYLELNETYEESRGGSRTAPYLLAAALRKITNSASIFSIQLLQDWLALGDLFEDDPWEIRINFPGTVGVKNWSLVMPVSLEEMKKLSINKEIKKINQASGRV